jgi:hypothetical protein
MKASLSSIALVFFLLQSALPLQAQRLNFWVGGTPGMDRDWHCPRNWSLGQIPNQFSDVIIPDVSTASDAMPLIRDGVVEVNSMRIDSNAVLEIGSEATLVVYNQLKKCHEKNLLVSGIIIEWEENQVKQHEGVLFTLRPKVNE